MAQINIILDLIKSTKNKHVYGKEGSSVQSIYVDKSALPDPAPKTLSLTLS